MSGPASSKTIAVRRRRLAGAAAFALLSCAPVLAGPNDELIAHWYGLLANADAPGLSSLLADNARIHLNDIGVEQTKAEFIDSMGEWALAVDGAEIRHRIDAENGAVTTVLACYDFPANDILIRETFAIKDGRIADNAQTTVAEDCAGY